MNDNLRKAIATVAESSPEDIAEALRTNPLALSILTKAVTSLTQETTQEEVEEVNILDIDSLYGYLNIYFEDNNTNGSIRKLDNNTALVINIDSRKAIVITFDDNFHKNINKLLPYPKETERASDLNKNGLDSLIKRLVSYGLTERKETF